MTETADDEIDYSEGVYGCVRVCTGVYGCVRVCTGVW